MSNEEIITIFNEMADILEIQKVQWKPAAYRAASRGIRELREDLKAVYRRGGIKELDSIPGVGAGIAKKIAEYIKTGKIKEYENLKKSIPAGLRAIMDIPGMGPKKAYLVYKKLKIKSLDDLKRAVEAHKVSKLPGFGALSEKKLLESLGMIKSHKKRQAIAKVLPIANKIVNAIKKMKEVEKIMVAGSLRRKEPTIGDIDILAVSSNPKKVMEKFVSLPVVKKVLAKGAKKSIVILKNNMQADLRVFDRKSFGAALQYFTGSKTHNIELRRIAIKKGYKLNEYGLFKAGKRIAGEKEEDIYRILGVKYIKPEQRKS